MARNGCKIAKCKSCLLFKFPVFRTRNLGSKTPRYILRQDLEKPQEVSQDFPKIKNLDILIFREMNLETPVQKNS